ncbi:MAG: AAA family ATPase, partial [Alcaligenaceae bacterium]
GGEAQRIQVLAKAQMTALTQDHSSYLRKWDEFGDLEGEILLAHAREIGGLKYSDLQLHRAGDDGKASVSVHIRDASISALAAFKKGRVPEVQLVEALPNYLANEALTFRDFAGEIERQADPDRWRDQAQQKQPASYFKVKDFEHETNRLTLATETLPLPSGMLVLSLAGEVAQIKRRMSARRAILEGRGANPQLGPLIEEKGKITPVRSTPKVPTLTAFVRDKVFRKPPTPMQERAISVALNTPDIAIIQGPPGTGKTTVIAAILERLNEMADKRGANIKGQVLLTGFQHDAVENMINGLSVNGIPVPKYGVRSDAGEDDVSAFERNLEDWCTSIAAKLRGKNPRIDEIQQEMEIKNLCLQYLRAPTRSLAVALVEGIASIGANILGQALVRRADLLARRLSREDQINSESARLVDATRRLRIREESFADDGPERAADALEDLAGMLESSERALLERASCWRPGDGRMLFLADLATLKKALLI